MPSTRPSISPARASSHSHLLPHVIQEHGGLQQAADPLHVSVCGRPRGKGQNKTFAILTNCKLELLCSSDKGKLIRTQKPKTSLGYFDRTIVSLAVCKPKHTEGRSRCNKQHSSLKLSLTHCDLHHKYLPQIFGRVALSIVSLSGEESRYKRQVTDQPAKCRMPSIPSARSERERVRRGTNSGSD